MKHLLSALAALTLFISCSNDNVSEVTIQPADYTAENDKEIRDYIAEKKLTAEKSDSGLYYVINEPGTGTQPTATSKVTVAYKGYHLNGTIFAQNTEGLAVDLTQVIKGWTEGIPHFKEGGDGILLIPSHLAYGSFAYGPIPGGSVLIYDIKLISVD